MHARIRAGDPDAFRELFRDHAQLVFRHAVRTTGDWSAAEDVVSLTFLEAWRLRGKLRDEGESPRPWLMGIAVNVLRNTGRAARRHERALARVPLRDVLPDFADELVGRMADSDELAAAKRALGKLRRSEREVFALCVWAGLGYAEVAEALGVPVGTVRSRLSRARARLRKLTDSELRRPGGRRGPGGAGPRMTQPGRTGPGGMEPGGMEPGGMEPDGASGQIQGGRTTAARSNEERTR
ncbi:RNA polymerase sigma factor [Streptomyces sp. CA-278952]|uniref:RNA polymerase sigma factor n=1 Tax=Streptomyces sp. CA-278952 TaxID=2980556 RepID=UPI002367BD69|nr:RNA polymerase sigma factor [Streptomyces sp. CA-278952]WDG30656.1 RNA polymerase sigma factor [Streptomyces sp. CA-278952]